MRPPPAQEALSEVATFQTMRDMRQEEAAQGLSFKSVWLAPPPGSGIGQFSFCTESWLATHLDDKA